MHKQSNQDIKTQAERAEIETLLEKIHALQHMPDVYLLQALVDSINTKQPSQTKEQFHVLVSLLNAKPKLACGLAQFLLRLITKYQKIGCLTDIGIASDKSFLDKLTKPLKRKLLPVVDDKDSLYDLINTVLISNDKHNRKWLLVLEEQDIYKFVLSLVSAYSQHKHNLSHTTLQDNFTQDNRKTLMSEHIADTSSLVVQASKQVSSDSTHRDSNNTDNANVALEKSQQTHESLLQTIYQAILILSYRLSGIGLHEELIRTYPQALNYHSAFIAQNTAVTDYVTQMMEAKWSESNPKMAIRDSSKHLIVMLSQCSDIVLQIRKQIFRQGLSISLMNKLSQIKLIIERIILLIKVTDTVCDIQIHADNEVSMESVQAEKANAISSIFLSLYQSTLNRDNFKHVIDDSLNLMSKKIVDNASKHGEHYISTDVIGYKNMFKKAAIGGVLIAVLALIKIVASSFELAPFGVAFINSMIYGIGFVIIHLIHGTVATKQPAMTAAAMASTIEKGKNNKKFKVDSLAHLTVDVIRTQFIAILGNVLLAMLIAFCICFSWMSLMDTTLISQHKADKLLLELNPLNTFAIFYAAIAGFYLFLSGVIAGYYDNKARYHQLSQRIYHHPFLVRYLKQTKRKKMGDFLEAHLGAIMSNFLFGIMLGSTATIGYIFGLPIDIRHIAFSSANFVYSVMHIGLTNVPVTVLLVSLLGVLCIGLVNLMVSFSLALMLALRAKGVQFNQWRELISLIAIHFIKHPKEFFIPRNKPIKYAKLDSNGKLIFE